MTEKNLFTPVYTECLQLYNNIFVLQKNKDDIKYKIYELNWIYE